jgi:hypothetical protein
VGNTSISVEHVAHSMVAIFMPWLARRAVARRLPASRLFHCGLDAPTPFTTWIGLSALPPGPRWRSSPEPGRSACLSSLIHRVDVDLSKQRLGDIEERIGILAAWHMAAVRRRASGIKCRVQDINPHFADEAGRMHPF